MGLWRAPRGANITVETIMVTDTTEFALVRRTEDGEGRRGAWMEMVLIDWDISEGDFVTVECVAGP